VCGAAEKRADRCDRKVSAPDEATTK